MALGLRQVLWGDGDLAEDEADARKVEGGRTKLLLECPNVVAPGNGDNVKAALELAETVAKAETERETNLNTRGAAVATVAGIIVTVAAVVAKPIFAPSNWTGFGRNLMEWLFLAALVSVASAMVMAVVGVLRPTRGGRTKNAVGAAVVNVWRQPHGDIALAAAADTQIQVFQLDRLLRAIPTWHYRNRSKARWLRRSWMFLMLGILLIGSAGVLLLAELRLPAEGEQAVQSEMTWTEIGVVIALTLITVWVLLRFDLVFARRGRGWKRGAEEKEREQAKDEAAKIVGLLVPPSYTPGVAGESSRRLWSATWMTPAIGRPGWRRLVVAGALSAAFVIARQLHRAAIEEGAAKKDQVSAFLADADEFIAITQSGSYVRLAPRSAVLEGLVQQLLMSSVANGD